MQKSAKCSLQGSSGSAINARAGWAVMGSMIATVLGEGSGGNSSSCGSRPTTTVDEEIAAKTVASVEEAMDHIREPIGKYSRKEGKPE